MITPAQYMALAKDPGAVRSLSARIDACIRRASISGHWPVTVEPSLLEEKVVHEVIRMYSFAGWSVQLVEATGDTAHYIRIESPI
jgi:hypothetical protein